MYVWCIALPFLLYLPSPLQSCLKKKPYYPRKPPAQRMPPDYLEVYNEMVGALRNKTKKKSDDPNLPHYNKSWSPWHQDAETTQMWDQWGDKFKHNFDDLTDTSVTIDPYSTEIPSYAIKHPIFANVKGPGYKGMEDSVPPWADSPINTGRPAQCFEFVSEGECPSGKQGVRRDRFYYDPYSNECKKFRYSGCGGNENNFMTKDLCINICVEYSPNGCSIDSRVPHDSGRYYHDIIYP